MSGSGKAYLAGAVGTMSSRVVSIVSGVISLWFLTRILGTAEFAGYSVAMSVVVLLGYSAGLGIERSLLVRIGGCRTDGASLAGARLMRANLLSATLLSGFAAVLTVAVLHGSPGVEQRFTRLLAPVIPATAMSLVLIVWYQANHRVGISQAMFGIGDGVRALCFAGCFAIGLGAAGVVVGAIAGATAPLVILAIRARGRTRQEPGGLGRSDVSGGLQFVLMRLSAMGLNHIDIIALGAMGSIVGTAQYAVAKRFAVLVQSGQAAFAPTFTPRVRRHLAQGRRDLTAQEYGVARVLGFVASLLLALCFLVLGEPLLVAFGSFGAGFGPFMLLVAAHLFSVGMGFHAAFLTMTDDISWSTANRLIGLAVFAAGLVVLVPRHDALGASAAFLIATILHDCLGIAILRARTGLVALSPADAVPVAAASLVLTAAGLGLLPRAGCALLLAALLLLTAHRHRELLGRVSRNLAGLVPRPGSGKR